MMGMLLETRHRRGYCFLMSYGANLRHAGFTVARSVAA
jgi:hypothetical protein